MEASEESDASKQKQKGIQEHYDTVDHPQEANEFEQMMTDFKTGLKELNAENTPRKKEYNVSELTIQDTIPLRHQADSYQQFASQSFRTEEQSKLTSTSDLTSSESKVILVHLQPTDVVYSQQVANENYDLSNREAKVDLKHNFSNSHFELSSRTPQSDMKSKSIIFQAEDVRETSRSEKPNLSVNPANSLNQFEVLLLANAMTPTSEMDAKGPEKSNENNDETKQKAKKNKDNEMLLGNARDSSRQIDVNGPGKSNQNDDEGSKYQHAEKIKIDANKPKANLLLMSQDFAVYQAEIQAGGAMNAASEQSDPSMTNAALELSGLNAFNVPRGVGGQDEGDEGNGDENNDNMEENNDEAEEYGEEYGEEDLTDSRSKLSAKFSEIAFNVVLQNHKIVNLKKEIDSRLSNAMRTMCDEREVEVLKSCIKSENDTLHDYIREIVCMQQANPGRFDFSIELATTFDEESMPLKWDKFLDLASSTIKSLSEERTPRLRKHGKRQATKQPKNAICEMKQKLAERDRVIYSLQQKIALLKDQMVPVDTKPQIEQANQRIEAHMKKQDCRAHNLVTAMDNIQNSIENLQQEVENIRTDKETHPMSAKEKCIKENLDMEAKYEELVVELKNKQKEYCDLKRKLDSIGKESPPDASIEEMKLLREKLKESIEEQEEYKGLICEQTKQIEEYREKFLNAQEKVEEQKCIIKKLGSEKKRIEQQINCEILRVKNKFQEKLQEWAKLPKVLEEEQQKLMTVCKEKQDLEMKYRIVSRELKLRKSKVDETGGIVDCKNCNKLEDELAKLKLQYDTLMDTKQRYDTKNQQLIKELDCLRAESAKMIGRLKERAEGNQGPLQRQIEELEKELANCRAATCLSIAERDELIKDMQTELNCLALSFDSTQKQIKSLKEHISYMHVSEDKWGNKI